MENEKGIIVQHGTLEEIKTICDFLNCTNIVKMK